MNEECALLHLMAMEVPVEIAEHLARWIQPGHDVPLYWVPHGLLVSFGGGLGSRMSHYVLLDHPPEGAQLVYSSCTGFNTAFRHPEECHGRGE